MIRSSIPGEIQGHSPPQFVLPLQSCTGTDTPNGNWQLWMATSQDGQTLKLDRDGNVFGAIGHGPGKAKASSNYPIMPSDLLSRDNYQASLVNPTRRRWALTGICISETRLYRTPLRWHRRINRLFS